MQTKPSDNAPVTESSDNSVDKTSGRIRRGPAALRAQTADKAPSRKAAGKAAGERGEPVELVRRPKNRARFEDPINAEPQVQDAAEENAAFDASSAPNVDFSEDLAQTAAETEVAFDDVIAGRIDDEDEDDESAQALEQHKRVLLPDAEQPKLHKVLAQAGMGSRLEMERLIQEGRVTVNDTPAHVGQRVQYGDQVKVNGKPIRFRIAPPPVRVLAYHKPAGEVVTRDDPQSRPTVFRKLPGLQHGKWQAVGRLDLNTEGLLLFTNSGDLANRLMHPSFGLEREYAVRVLGALTEEEKQRLLDGVRLDDGDAAFGSIYSGGGEGVNQWYKVTISEGRNREVRRMMEAVGHAVSRLIRIRYGSVPLMRGLRRGMSLDLSDRDVQRLMQEAGMEQASPVAQSMGLARNGQRATAARARSQGFVAPEVANARRSNDRRTGGQSAGRSMRVAPAKPSDGFIGQDSINQHRLKQKRQNRR